MRLDYLNLVMSILIPVGVGYGCLTIIFRKLKLNILMILALSFPLGMGILTSWMLNLAILKIPFGFVSIALPPLLISAIILLTQKFYKNNSHKTVQSSSTNTIFSRKERVVFDFSIVHLILKIYITFQIIFVFWQALSVPIWSWDAFYVIAIKAKIFFFDKNISKLLFLPHASYPLGIEFAMTWVAVCLGAWDDFWVNIIFPLLYICYLIVHFEFLNYFTNRRWALIGLILVTSSNFFNFHATIAYRDFPMMFYTISPILLVILGYHKKEWRYFLMAGLFAGLGCFIKLEAVGYFLIQLMLMTAIMVCDRGIPTKIKFKSLLSFTIPSAIILLTHHLFKISLGLALMEGRLRVDFRLFELNRLKLILEDFFNSLFVSGNWNMLWFFLCVTLILYWKKVKEHFEIQYLLAALGLFFTLDISLNLFTTNLISHPTAINRVLLHFFPLCPLLITLLYCPRNIKN